MGLGYQALRHPSKFPKFGCDLSKVLIFLNIWPGSRKKSKMKNLKIFPNNKLPLEID